MTDLKYVTKWCEEYSEAHGVKIFPQSAPLLMLINELMGVVGKHQAALVGMAQSMIDINAQIKTILDCLSELKQHEETIKVRGVDVPIKDLVKKPIKKR